MASKGKAETDYTSTQNRFLVPYLYFQHPVFYSTLSFRGKREDSVDEGQAQEQSIMGTKL